MLPSVYFRVRFRELLALPFLVLILLKIAAIEDKSKHFTQSEQHLIADHPHNIDEGRIRAAVPQTLGKTPHYPSHLKSALALQRLH